MSRLDAAVAVGDAPAMEALIDEFLRVQRTAEELLSPAQRLIPGAPLELHSGAQSKQFMIDLLPRIQAHLALFPRGTSFTVLDVGPGTGHGAALLSSLYASTELGYRLAVTAVDVTDFYHHYIRLIGRYMRHVIDDIYTMNETYDIVICSAVIEHVNEPLRFCRRLQQLARQAVFIVAPYNEPRERLIKGHRNVIDSETVAAMAPRRSDIIHSVSWGAFYDPPYETVIAELPGLAAP